MAQCGKSSVSLCHPTKTTESEDSQVVRSLSRPGSIKKSVEKIPSEGLVELSPEPGPVKFESQGIPRLGSGTAFASVVRGGSAGRVERSLQLARKKELVDEIPRRNSTGAETIFNEKIKLSEQKEEIENSPRQDAKGCPHKEDSDSELSSSSDDISEGKGKDNGTADQINNTEALVQLKAEFLKAVMDEDYGKAKELCQKILLLEPDNKLCSEFHAVIVEKIQQDAFAIEDSEGDDDSDDGDESSEESNESVDDGQESDDSNSEDDDEDDDDDDDDEESDSDDDCTLPSSPINLIMGGLPIKPQNR